MNYKLYTVPVGPLQTNTYVYTDLLGVGVVIDPGAEAWKIEKIITSKNLLIKYVILTHAHYDHVMATDRIRELTGARVIIYKEENELLEDNMLNLFSQFDSLSKSPPKADVLVTEMDTLTAGKLEFKFIHTPGHTKGSMCIISKDIMFSGDTLFYRSYGRMDFPTGSHTQMADTFKNKLYPLEVNYKVYPGHMQSTTLFEEKELNEMFLREK